MDIAVFGQGFIGKYISEQLDNTALLEYVAYDTFNYQKIRIIPITRENYKHYIGLNFDVFINCAGSNKAYLANKNPNVDFKESVQTVYDTFFHFRAKKYIYFSSIAAFDPTSGYGFNKILSEEIVKRYSQNYVIYRCCNVIDKDRDIGIIPDIINGVPLFVTPDSKYQFITRKALIDIITDTLKYNYKNETYNIAGRGYVVIQDLADILNRNIIYQDNATYREYVMPNKCPFHVRSTRDYVEELIKGN